MCLDQDEDVVGAATTGDAPTTSEWSTILLPTKVWLILEVWRYKIMNYAYYAILFGENSLFESVLAHCEMKLETCTCQKNLN